MALSASRLAWYVSGRPLVDGVEVSAATDATDVAVFADAGAWIASTLTAAEAAWVGVG